MVGILEQRQPLQLCEDETTLFGQHSRMYFSGLATLPWRTQLRSGALPLNDLVRPLVTSLCGPRRTEMQALIWPHVLHRYDVFYIDNPLYSCQPPAEYSNTMDSGFVVPLLLRIAEPCGRRHLGRLYSEGPLAVVVTCNLEESMALVESMRTVTQQLSRSFRIVNFFESKNDKGFQEKSYAASENCDVLIVTLNAVMQLFLTQGRLGSPPINVLKVEFVVLRNIDVMLRFAPTIVEQMMTRFVVNPDINYVFAASSPSPNIKQVLSKLENTCCTVITNMLDAIIYEKLPVEILEANPNLPWALSALKTFSDRTNGDRIVLFVKSSEQAGAIRKALLMDKEKSKTKYDFMTANEDKPVYEYVSTIRDWWKTENKEAAKILAIPDSITSDFGINDADLIVHLSPPESIHHFMRRFCLIKNNFMIWSTHYQYLNKLAHGASKPPYPAIPCRIIVDESWRHLLPLLVHVASASPQSVMPESLITKSLAALEDPDFLRVPPCLQQMYVGECMSPESCAYRHYQGPPRALPTALAAGRGFEFSIMRFLNPTHFIVRIVSYRTAEGQIVQVDRSTKAIDEHLANVLDELPAPLAEVPPPGLICGMLSNDSTKMYRVEVLTEIDEDFLHVHYVDEGIGMAFAKVDRRHPKLSAIVKKTTNFYPLPEELQKMEKTWVNLIVSKIMPSAQELGWRPAVCGDVYAAMKNFITDKSLMEAESLFVTEDFVFVENFKCHTILEGNRTLALSMKNILNRYAESYAPNLDHLAKLQSIYNEKSANRGHSSTVLLPLSVTTRSVSPKKAVSEIDVSPLPNIMESMAESVYV